MSSLAADLKGCIGLLNKLDDHERTQHVMKLVQRCTDFAHKIDVRLAKKAASSSSVMLSPGHKHSQAQAKTVQGPVQGATLSPASADVHPEQTNGSPTDTVDQQLWTFEQVNDALQQGLPSCQKLRKVTIGCFPALALVPAPCTEHYHNGAQEPSWALVMPSVAFFSHSRLPNGGLCPVPV
jgi:hypothetical protein